VSRPATADSRCSLRRRKNSPARNAAAERDAARKRKARGGYKTIQKQYEEFIASLPQDQQLIARALSILNLEDSVPIRLSLRR